MRLIRLAMAVMAVSFSWAAMANPAVNNSVSGSVSGTVSTTAATQMVGGAAQVRLDGAGLKGDARASSRSSSTTRGMNESVPSGWLMALVTVLLIGHQLRRKHRFLRPQRFTNI
jgi:hypothetical protein